MQKIIRMTQSRLATPDGKRVGYYVQGKEYTLPEVTACYLIQQGWAEFVKNITEEGHDDEQRG